MVRHRIGLISLILYSLLAFVLLIVVFHFAFGFQYVVILTDSMKPTINPGDLVVTRPVSPDELHVGDIILYRVTVGDSTYRITHRIVDVRTDEDGNLYYVTRGDNRKYADPWRVYPDQVVGRVVLRIPGVGNVLLRAPLIAAVSFIVLMASIAYEIGVILTEGEDSEEREKALLQKNRRMYMVRRARKPGKGNL
ncbi:S26 family signal peptidase [Thermococcus profundus]|uniref:S26 family signal peptidase n=1 Tax=Thermococcus profundus TaxID=49899 RepID=A0A2Z2M6S9_THEPR|nr:signal peptidase I [Thermococcus profundus]ASJ02110.1 S26 family signal peptidase [Thermococcus profundus]